MKNNPVGSRKTHGAPVRFLMCALLFLSAFSPGRGDEEGTAEEPIEAKVNLLFTTIRMTKSSLERGKCLRELFFLGKAAEESVMEYLGDADKSAVIDAIKFLCYIASRRAHGEIMALTIHPNKEIRFYAVLGLSHYTDDATVRRIAEVLFEEKDPEVRKAAVLSLMMIKNPLKMEFFVRALSSLKRGGIRDLCLRSFQKVMEEQEYVPALVAAFKKHAEEMPRFLRLDILRGIGDAADRRTISFFAERFATDDPKERAFCAIGLGKIGDTRAVDVLRRHVGDPSAVVREKVKESLRILTGFDGWDAEMRVRIWLRKHGATLRRAAAYEEVVENALGVPPSAWRSLVVELRRLEAGKEGRDEKVFSGLVTRCLMSGNRKTVDFAVYCFEFFQEALRPALTYLLKWGSTPALAAEERLPRACELASIISYRYGMAENIPYIIAYLKNLESLNRQTEILIRTPVSYTCLRGLTGVALGQEASRWERWWNRTGRCRLAEKR